MLIIRSNYLHLYRCVIVHTRAAGHTLQVYRSERPNCPDRAFSFHHSIANRVALSHRWRYIGRYSKQLSGFVSPRHLHPFLSSLLPYTLISPRITFSIRFPPPSSSPFAPLSPFSSPIASLSPSFLPHPHLCLHHFLPFHLYLHHSLDLFPPSIFTSICTSLSVFISIRNTFSIRHSPPPPPLFASLYRH